LLYLERLLFFAYQTEHDLQHGGVYLLLGDHW